MKNAVTTPNAPEAIGPYSQSILFQGNKLLFVSGQIPKNPVTGLMVEGDIKAMTKQVLENIEAILKEGGSSIQQVLRVEVFLIDMNDFQAMNEVYADFFGQPPYPARQTVQVSKLPMNARVEISCIAAAS